MKRIGAALLALLPSAALACGYCVEDKVASTYDHAVVTRALGLKHHVAFFHIEGSPVTRRALEAALAALPGVDKGSARISVDTLTVSLAFDPRRVSLAELNAQLDRALARRKLSAMPLRVMEQPADLKTVKR